MIDLQNCLPKSLYFNFSQIATSSAKEIENFANLIQADTSQEVFNRAKESQAESPEGITWWKVTEHDDWLNVQQEKYPQDLTLPMKEDTIPNNYEVENVKNVLENFQKGKDYIELSFIDKKSWKIKVINMATI